jgi:WhiB family redox-sensing transcriptional regulator
MVAQTIPQSAVQPDWERLAACANSPQAVVAHFFSDDLTEISAAKRICETCPVMGNCLRTALERDEQWGVWGGQLFMAGKIVLNKRRRGRPPKVARPEDQLLQVPLPDEFRYLVSA